MDRALRTIAARRAALDAEEARWLREAEALQIWRPLGMVSALDYLERVLGYAPRTAQERLRVARALGSLPQLTAALAGGALAYSAVRELTRVVTPATEAPWIAVAVGKNVREIEELVADRRVGDRPDDPPDPQARRHVVRFELSAETFALLRQARRVLDDEHVTSLDDDALVAALCGAVLDGASSAEPTGRAKFQVAITVCKCCQQGWQEGAGAQIPIDAGAVERALCDAQHIGSIDGDVPERAYQDISPSVKRLVWRRDGGRCRVPGCRSSRGIEVHHIVHRSDGGSNDALNLALLCSACHQSHHAGILAISGTADHLQVTRPGCALPPIAASPAPVDAHVGASGTATRIVSTDLDMAAAHMSESSATTRIASTDLDMAAAHVDAGGTEARIASTDLDMAAAHVDAGDTEARIASTDLDMAAAHVNAGGTTTRIASTDLELTAARANDAHVGASGTETRIASTDLDLTAAHVGASGTETQIASTDLDMAAAHVDAGDTEAPIAGTKLGVAAAYANDAHVGASGTETQIASTDLDMAAAHVDAGGTEVPIAGTKLGVAAAYTNDAHVSASGAKMLLSNTDLGVAAFHPGDAHVGASGTAVASAHRGRAPSTLDTAILRTQAKSALTSLGWKPAIAHAAVARALSEQGADISLERLIFESLRRCPVPRA